MLGFGVQNNTTSKPGAWDKFQGLRLCSRLNTPSDQVLSVVQIYSNMSPMGNTVTQTSTSSRSNEASTQSGQSVHPSGLSLSGLVTPPNRPVGYWHSVRGLRVEGHWASSQALICNLALSINLDSGTGECAKVLRLGKARESGLFLSGHRGVAIILSAVSEGLL